MPDAHTASRRGRERYGLLLGAILAAFAIEGVAEPAQWAQIVTTALLGMTLLLALVVSGAKPRFVRVAAVLVVAVVIVSVVEAISGNVDGGSTRAANALLVILAPPAIVAGVLRSLRSSGTVTVEAVFGVLCVYILVGMFFAFAYGALDRYGDAFFSGGQAATVANCLYFSFTTLTTVGYGDLTAATNLGHTLSASEALLGQIYLVTVVSVLVANLGRRRQPQERRTLGGGREAGDRET